MIGNRAGRSTPAGGGRRRRRGAVWLTVIAVPALAVTAAVAWLAVPHGPGGSGPVRGAAHQGRGAGDGKAVGAVSAASLAAAPRVAGVVPRAGGAVRGRSGGGVVRGRSGGGMVREGTGGGVVRGRAGGGVLEPRVRRACAAAAIACADLADHITWLQSRGRISYGPVRMEPGGRADPTPRGIFHVAWKAGAHYISTSYGVPIPYAVFFAAGGIAFHAGSLTSSSHGCIHLTLASARYYHDHLPIGAEVDVF